MGLPSWRYEIDGRVIEKSVVVPSRHNIVHITFRLLGDDREARLRLRPFINFRPLEAPVGEALASGLRLPRGGNATRSPPDLIFRPSTSRSRAATARVYR